ncbi:hypothetical protein TraAM80_03759 [Trypanosoma rangeli]|uniref:Uncharacterized protein n=1 Tax=Trypanosoma rangeli TaxID=5698 RepID=A0A422NMU1_TRYRA|nr:uncharacterized protein TraAM80_03759 [Trypanosoma rangeli]RNF06736.1 hypothetical protein TraAM80_03759 [Trypanosoma rangeli]|eukprot:RNF06736.1 hypothetical protein TraAM80_03759 [Trypanosoma rangeli]
MFNVPQQPRRTLPANQRSSPWDTRDMLQWAMAGETPTDKSPLWSRDPAVARAGPATECDVANRPAAKRSLTGIANNGTAGMRPRGKEEQFVKKKGAERR